MLNILLVAKFAVALFDEVIWKLSATRVFINCCMAVAVFRDELSMFLSSNCSCAESGVKYTAISVRNRANFCSMAIND